jgi:dipeptidyl-peptidase III
LWLNTIGEIRKGALGQISAYNPASKKWKQAHTQGAWVITNFILQNQKSKVLEIKLNEKKDYFHIKLDKELMFTEGHELVKNLLHIMQTYKSSGAVDRAKKFYDKYSEVP